MNTDEFGNGGEPSNVKDGYMVGWEVSNVVFYQSGQIIEAADCLPIVPQAARGERYGQTPVRVSDTVFSTTYGFVPGSSQVTVDGIQQRNGIDYEEDPAAGEIIFAEPVPSTSNVYIYYETVV